MSMFGEEGQAAVDPFSDDAIYVETEVDTPQEGQLESDTNEGIPAASSGPADEQTSQDSSEGTSEEAPQDGQADSLAEEMVSRKQYDELRKLDTRVAMENSRLKQQLAQLMAQQPAPVITPPQPAAEPSKDFVKTLLEQGDRALLPLIEQVATQKAAALVQPIYAEREKARVNSAVDAAIKDAAPGWGQLDTPDGKAQMVSRMFELSAMQGDPNLWQKQPDFMVFRACRDLWGLPKVADQSAIEAARKTERENMRREMDEAPNKNGLTINTTANKGGDGKELTPEEQIAAEIRALSGGGMFG